MIEDSAKMHADQGFDLGQFIQKLGQYLQKERKSLDVSHKQLQSDKTKVLIINYLRIALGDMLNSLEKALEK